MVESVVGEENSAGNGKTGTETGPMTGTGTETDPTTESETVGTAEGINRLLRATTLSIRGHNMTATKLSGFVSIWTV